MLELLPSGLQDLFASEIREIECCTMNGVVFWIVRLSSGHTSVVIRCPRCGELGRLVKYGKHNRKLYRVLHNKYYLEKGGCPISVCSPWLDLIDEIYKIARGVER